MIVSREKSEIHPLANKITSLCPGVCLAARTHNSSRKRKKRKSYIRFVSEHTPVHISARFGAGVRLNFPFRRVVGS